jgi:hypothetical protein
MRNIIIHFRSPHCKIYTERNNSNLGNDIHVHWFALFHFIDWDSQVFQKVKWPLSHNNARLRWKLDLLLRDLMLFPAATPNISKWLAFVARPVPRPTQLHINKTEIFFYINDRNATRPTVPGEKTGNVTFTKKRLFPPAHIWAFFCQKIWI